MESYCIMFSPIVIAIIGVTTFIVSGRTHKLHDKLFLALLVCSIMNMYIVLRNYFEGPFNYGFIFFDNVQTLVGLSICPLLYLLIRSLACGDRWQNWYPLLLAPAFIMCLIGTTLSIDVGWNNLINMRIDVYMPLLINPYDKAEVLYKFINIDLYNILIDVMLAISLCWSLWFLIRHHKKADRYFDEVESSSLRSLDIFLMTTILYEVTLFLVSNYIRTIFHQLDMMLYASFWIDFLAFIMIRFAYKIKVKEIDLSTITVPITIRETGAKATLEEIENTKLKEIENTTPEEIKDDQSEVDMNDIIERKLKAWINRSDKPWSIEGLTIRDLSNDINVNERVLSTYLNGEKRLNFNSWLNNVRIEVSKKFFSKDPNIKIGYVASVCGFNDQSAFSNVFRRIVGCSPTQYKQSLEETRKKRYL